MKLLGYGLAVGLGYLLGRPDGRERLAQFGRQAAGLAQRPEVVRLRERGMDVATERAQAVKQKVVARSRSTDSPDADGPTGSADAGSDAGVAAPRSGRGLRAPSWRPSFRRSRAAHFPPSEDPAPAPATTLGGTTVMEDSEAARLGMPVASQAPPIDRP